MNAEYNLKNNFRGFSSDEQSSTLNEAPDAEIENVEPTVWDQILQEAGPQRLDRRFVTKELNLWEKACHQAYSTRLPMDMYCKVWDEISHGFICQIYSLVRI